MNAHYLGDYIKTNPLNRNLLNRIFNVFINESDKSIFTNINDNHGYDINMKAYSDGVLTVYVSNKYINGTNKCSIYYNKNNIINVHVSDVENGDISYSSLNQLEMFGNDEIIEYVEGAIKLVMIGIVDLFGYREEYGECI